MNKMEMVAILSTYILKLVPACNLNKNSKPIRNGGFELKRLISPIAVVFPAGKINPQIVQATYGQSNSHQ
jgi:hypothetical protein